MNTPVGSQLAPVRRPEAPRPLDVDVLVGALAAGHRQAVALRARLRVLEEAARGSGVLVPGELAAREAELDERERRLNDSAEKLRRRHEKLLRRRRALVVREEQTATPEVSTPSRDFNLHMLEQRVAERRREFPELSLEWDSYLLSLRAVADASGNLPASMDSLVDEVFAPLL